MNDENMKMIYPIGKAYVLRPAPLQDNKKKRATKTEEEQREYLTNCRRHSTISRKKRERAIETGKTFLKKTENLTPESEEYNLTMRQNRAIQTHFIYFSALSRIAHEKNWRVGYGIFGKRIKPEDRQQIHKNIKNWIQRNETGCYVACSIGIFKRGYIHIYYLFTGEEDLLINDISMAFARYLRKKNFRPLTNRPYETEATDWVYKHYNENIESSLDLITNCWDECYCMLRSSWALPYKRHTIRTKKTKRLIDESSAIWSDTYSIHREDRTRYFNTFSIFVCLSDDGFESEDLHNNRTGRHEMLIDDNEESDF